MAIQAGPFKFTGSRKRLSGSRYYREVVFLFCWGVEDQYTVR